MALSSLELTRRCVASGLLSKEAADEVLHIRQRLYKKAMAEKAAGVFGEIGRRLRGTASAAAHKSSGFIDDLKNQLGFAGMTGAKQPVHAAGAAEYVKKLNPITGMMEMELVPIGGTVIKDLPKKPKSWGELTGDLAKMLALGAGLQGTGMAVTGLMRHSRDKEMRRDIEKSYKDMFAETPSLANLDPKKVTRHFDVLARYAPSLAADPTVAGAWVKSTVQMGHIDTSSVERLGATQAMIDRHHEGKALFQPGHFPAAMNIARAAMGGGGSGGGGGG